MGRKEFLQEFLPVCIHFKIALQVSCKFFIHRPLGNKFHFSSFCYQWSQIWVVIFTTRLFKGAKNLVVFKALKVCKNNLKLQESWSLNNFWILQKQQFFLSGETTWLLFSLFVLRIFLQMLSSSMTVLVKFLMDLY